MGPLPRISLAEFREGLVSPVFRLFQILHIAFSILVLMVLGLVVWMYVEVTPDLHIPEARGDMNVMTFLHFAMTTGIMLFGATNARRLFKDDLFREIQLLRSGKTSSLSPAQQWVLQFSKETMIFLGSLEGSALFGLATIALGIITGMLAENPIYDMNLLTTLVLLIVLWKSFPTRSRLERRFLRKLSQETTS